MQLIGGKLRAVLTRALALSAALDRWHIHHGPHGHISPNSVTFGDGLNAVIAAPGLNASADFQDLRYASPEVAARVARVDQRSDLYSAGVMLYEWLVGAPPFRSDDVLDLLHEQIAMVPRAPADVAFGVPVVVSDLVMKLLAKSPEARYASARGLRHDLEVCLRHLHTFGRIDSFPLGAIDRGSQFLVPDKLYGREHELETLARIYRRAVAGEIILCTVAGYSGIGKSALVRAMRDDIVASGGVLVEGKFDQYRRDQPYSAVVEIFRGLLRLVLAGDSATVERWRALALASLDQHASVILDLLPEMERLIGPQAPAPELTGAAARTRFESVITALLRCFASPEQPLVMFLDDLQWIDDASLALVRAFVAAGRGCHLLIVGAYRDNEVDASHPLEQLLVDLRAMDAPITEFHLGPLHAEHVAELISDTCYNFNQVAELTNTLMVRTEGNPFFVRQFLKQEVSEGELYFFEELQSWRWRGAENVAGQHEDVVDLMTRRLSHFSIETRALLSTGATIGKRFSLPLLASVAGLDEEAALRDLAPALQDELLHAVSAPGATPEFQFVHDRVQQAAYLQTPADDRAALHLSIGRRLRALTLPAELENDVFAIVDQYNVGLELVVDANERAELARLNMLAGVRAKAAMAYVAASTYLVNGSRLLPRTKWTDYHDLTYELYANAAEANSVLNRDDVFEAIISEMLDNCRTPNERLRVRTRQAIHLCQTGRFELAIDIGWRGLAEVGIDIPSLDDPAALTAAFDAEMAQVRALCGERTLAETVRSLPTASDAITGDTLRLFGSLGDAATILNTPLLSLMGVIGTHRSISDGNTALSPLMYTFLAQAFTAQGRSYNEAYELAQVALQLSEERFVDAWTSGRLLVHFFWFIRHWVNHAMESLPLIEDAFVMTRRAHDPIYGAYLLSMATLTWFESGGRYGAVVEAHRRVVEHCRPYPMDVVVAFTQPSVGASMALRGETSALTDLNCAYFDERTFTAAFRDKPMVMGLLRCAQVPLFTLAGEYTRALVLAGDHNVDRSPPFLPRRSLRFWSAVAHARLAWTATGAERDDHLAQLTEAVEYFAQLATDAGPANVAHREMFLRAELARHFDTAENTAALVHEAMRLARAGGFTLEEGYFAESLATQILDRRGEPHAATMLLERAAAAYRSCGATLLHERVEALRQSRLGDAGLSFALAESFDFDRIESVAITRSAKIITEERDKPALLARLLQNLVEVSGAERGLIIRSTGDDLQVEASRGASSAAEFPIGLVRYVANATQTVSHSRGGLLSAAQEQWREPYFERHRVASVLCVPVGPHVPARRVLYLEHQSLADAFQNRRSSIDWLAGQLAQAVDNVEFYAEVGELVEARTSELRAANELLEQQRAELAFARDAAEAASESRASFIAMVGHELRAPISAIIGDVHQLMANAHTSAERKSLNRISFATTQMLALLDDVRDLARIDAGMLALDHERFELLSVVQEVGDYVRRLSNEKRLELIFDVAPNVPNVVMGDPWRLRQVLHNLVVNAVKFTEQGRVLVKISATAVSDTATSLLFRVEDTGIGIEPDQLGRLFREYTQLAAPVSRSYGGTGLGLAICKRLVVLFGGDIGAASEVGKGSVFWFNIPVQSVDGTDEVRDDELRGAKAFVVSSNELAVRSLVALLDRFGLDVSRCRSIEELRGELERDASHDANVDIVVIDEDSLGNDAGAALARMRGAFKMPLPAVVLLHSLSSSGTSVSTLCDASIERPVLPESVRDAVRDGLRNRAVGREAEDPKSLLRNKRVLLIDDNATVREVWAEIFADEGMHVEVAATGKAARDLIFDHEFDVVLMDVHLPDADGRQITREIRKFRRFDSLPIIALTGANSHEYATSCFEAGMNAFLAKPFRANAIFDVLTSWTRAS